VMALILASISNVLSTRFKILKVSGFQFSNEIVALFLEL
jgi:hypothetical protein